MRAFRRAYQALSLPGKLVAVDIDPLAPALQEVDAAYIVPRLDDPAYVPALTTLIRQEAITAVFPLIDPDIPVLAQHREMLEAAGARLMVAPLESVAIAADKWRTAQFFDALGLPTPRSWLPEQIDADRASYPLFIKPRRGSASQHTFKVRSAAELRFFAAYVPDPIVQEFLPGPEITSDVACDLDGHLLGVVSRQRIQVRGGEVTRGRTVYHPAIVDGCRRVAEALQVVGPITVQCMLNGDAPCFTEINARYGGGAPLGFQAGADSPRWFLALLAGMPPDAPPPGTYEVGLHLSRFDDSHFLRQSDLDRLAARRI